MIAPERAARDLEIKHALGDGVAAHGFRHHMAKCGAAHRHRHLDRAQRAFQTFEMFRFVDEESAGNAADFIHGIAKLKPAIFDVNRGRTVAQIAPVDICDASGWSPRVPAVAQALKLSRPLPPEPTPRDLSLRCSAERSMPMKAAVREMLPPKRLICATR